MRESKLAPRQDDLWRPSLNTWLTWPWIKKRWRDAMRSLSSQKITHLLRPRLFAHAPNNERTLWCPSLAGSTRNFSPSLMGVKETPTRPLKQPKHWKCVHAFMCVLFLCGMTTKLLLFHLDKMTKHDLLLSTTAGEREREMFASGNNGQMEEVSACCKRQKRVESSRSRRENFAAFQINFYHAVTHTLTHSLSPKVQCSKISTHTHTFKDLEVL